MTLCCIVIVIYLGKKSGFTYRLINFWVIGYLITAIPNCFLHFQYYYYNHKTMLDILPEEAKLIYIDKAGKSEAVEFSEINKVIVFMPPSMYIGNKFPLLPFEDYHYAKIYTSLGKEIVITSLMTPKVEDVMRAITGVTIEREKKYFASIS